MLQKACGYSSQLGILRYLKQHGYCGMLGTQVRVRCPTLEIANWIHSNLRSRVSAVYESNFHSSQGFDMLKLARLHGASCSVPLYRTILENAAFGGDLEALHWILSNRIEECSKRALNIAVSHGQLHVVKWLYGHYPREYFDEITGRCDDLVIIQWALNDYQWSSPAERKAWIGDCPNDAKLSYKLEVIEYLSVHGLS